MPALVNYARSRRARIETGVCAADGVAAPGAGDSGDLAPREFAGDTALVQMGRPHQA
jgi:hypothetical protein